MKQNNPAIEQSRINLTLSGNSFPFGSILLVVFLLMGSGVLAQTTVQLEQQCDCQILSGTAVSTPGSTTPTGADTGDIYVNTSIGALFFWDGDSWEITRSFNNSLSSISFDPATSRLTMETEDGRTFSADLSALIGAGTPDAVDINYDNTTSGIPATNVQEAIDTVSDLLNNFPMIYATGKVNGSGTALTIHRSSVMRIDEGDYQITFDTALPDTEYIIQVSVLDCGGDCPGNTTENYDNPGITYYDQQPEGFKVNIGDSDNGANPKDDIDLEFMFTVITLPN